MTTSLTPAGPAPAGPARPSDRLRVSVLPSRARLLRIELRRNAMLWMLPVAAALFWYQAYRKTMELPPMWNLRAMTLQNDAPLDFSMPVVGAAAWMGWRESRRQMSEMLTGMPRAVWGRRLVTWAATAAWAVAGYLVCAGVVYVATGVRASGGGPLWWPLAVGAASVVALSALGFAAGALLPSRFTAPLVVVVAFFGLGFSNSGAHGNNSVLMLSPLIVGAPDVGADPGVATFYRYLPDLSIVQLMFAAGLTLALLGALGFRSGSGWSGWPARSGWRAWSGRRARSGGWRVRAVAALLLAAGVTCAGVAASLVRTGSLDIHGMIRIPALHDAADDQPLQYTPVCAGSPVPVCMNPLYRAWLPEVVSALEPAVGAYAGMPGEPARLDQAAQVYLPGREGGIEVTAPVSASRFVLPGLPGVHMDAGQFPRALRASVGIPLLMQVLGLSGRSGGAAASPVQQAVFAAISGFDRTTARNYGVDPGLLPAPGSPAAAAARRFAALPRPAEHAWLAAHITALRAGHLTLTDLP